MELRLRKKIINSLPKFDPGKSELPTTVQNAIVPNTNVNFQPFWQRQMNYNDKASPLYVKNPGTITPRTNDHLERKQQGQRGQQIASAAPQILQQGMQFTGDVLKSFGPVKSEKELLSDAGNDTGTVMGVGYETQNSINSEALLELLKAENTSNTLSTAASGAALGGTIGSIFPGAGTAIGAVGGAIIGGITGIFGSARRKRKLKEKMINANLLAQRTNMFNRTSAMSSAMEQNWALQHSNTQDDIIYANRGKDLKQPKYNRL